MPLLLTGLAGNAYFDDIVDRLMPLLDLVWLPLAAAPQLDFPLFG
ncbi:hypothetical protein [Kinneretia aquatilis]|nr:hypothetical protein [Paucibacter aquatile]